MGKEVARWMAGWLPSEPTHRRQSLNDHESARRLRRWRIPGLRHANPRRNTSSSPPPPPSLARWPTRRAPTGKREKRNTTQRGWKRVRNRVGNSSELATRRPGDLLAEWLTRL